MNIGSIIGTVGLFLVTAAGMTKGFTNFEGLVNFLHFPSLMIVLGGTFFSTIYSCSFSNFTRLFTIIPEVFKTPSNKMINTLVVLVDVAKIARKNVLAIEHLLPKIKNQFMKEGLQLVVDRIDREQTAKILTSEMKYSDQQRTADAKMVKLLSTLAPAWGMIGTLFGLVLLLKNLGGGAEVIGDAMATAIITTLYGAVFSNGVFLPWYYKLIEIRDEERVLYEMIKTGILAIENNQRSELLEQDLKNYLKPELRKKYQELKFKRSRKNNTKNTKAVNTKLSTSR